MSRTLKLLTDEDAMHWPRLCARCGSTDSLRSVEALIAARKATRHGQSEGIPIGSDVLSVDYPVCDRHARFLTVAQWLTRNTLVPRVVRAFCYAIGSGSLLALVLKLGALALAAVGVLRGIDASLPLLTVEFVLAWLLVLVLWAYRVTPVRLTRLENGRVTIRFGSDPYAQVFAQANPGIVTRRGGASR